MQRSRSEREPRSATTVGLLSGFGAYGLWGLFPAFFGLLSFAGSVEILAHRIVWTLLLMLVVLAVGGRLGSLRGLGGRTWGIVALSSGFISINWGMYIYAVSSDRVVEAALGYFINPLVSVLLGVVFFKERLNRLQVIAVILAVTAVVVMTVATDVPRDRVDPRVLVRAVRRDEEDGPTSTRGRPSPRRGSSVRRSRWATW